MMPDYIEILITFNDGTESTFKARREDVEVGIAGISIEEKTGWCWNFIFTSIKYYRTQIITKKEYQE